MHRAKPKPETSKVIRYLAYGILAIVLAEAAILLLGIVTEDIRLTEWQRRIDDHEVIAITATVADRQIDQYFLRTGRNGGGIYPSVCTFKYAYKVNGTTYTASETYPENIDSLCQHREISEIQIYYDPKNPGDSISAKMGHEGQAGK